jgi:hypothetical protein
MRILLHIGQQKTGTTALQHVLVEDAPRLRELGILYPDTAHQRSDDGGLRPSHNALFFRLQGNKGPKLWQSLEEIRADLETQIAESAPETVLISAEHAIMAADQQADILAGFDAILPGPKDVVAYLRRPDRYLMSFHKQLIRLGRRLTPLHEPERIDALEQTCQLDHRRALQLHLDHYGSLTVHDYESAGDTVGHFYRNVLGIEPPPTSRPRRNPSIPDVFADLALRRVADGNRLTPGQIAALIAHGEAERVDLLGAGNRARVLEYYRPHDAWLGSLTGRSSFFDDLDDLAAAPEGWLSAAEADERYRELFDVLMASPTLDELRRDCRVLESAGMVRAAGTLFETHRHGFGPLEIDAFRADLERSSRGDLTLDDRGHYIDRSSAPPPEASAAPPRTRPHRAAAKLRRGAGAARRRISGS